MAKPWKWAWPIAALGLGLAWMLSFGLLPNHGVASARSQVSTESPIVFGGDAHYAPFDSLDEHGQPIGFDVELFRAVAAHAGLDVHYRLGNWQQVQADLQAGSIDVIPMLVTPERKLRVRFSQPFMRRYYQAFGKRGAPYIASLDALRGQRVAAQTADMAWEELRRIPGIVLVDTDSEGGALVAVAEGRADYAMAPTFIGYEAKRRFGLEDVVPLSTAFFETEYAFAVRPDRAALLARINSGLTAATRSGEASRLYERWLANLTPTPRNLAFGPDDRLVDRDAVVPGRHPAAGVVAPRTPARRSSREPRPGHRPRQSQRLPQGARAPGRQGAPFAVIRIDLLESARWKRWPATNSSTPCCAASRNACNRTSPSWRRPVTAAS
jgi:ABC-type amino acid transport substrate-binding protein